MDAKQTPLFGSIIMQNQPVKDIKPEIVIPGQFKSKNEELYLDEDILSKHILMIGGTGCGKSNAFYHIYSQLKGRMTKDDVAIVFDTKGDYYQKFGKPNDLLIGNSASYRSNSQKWNVFREILSDGWDMNNVTANTQEVSWAIFREAIEKSKDPFFPNAARDLFSSILMCILETGAGDISYKKEFFYNSELKRSFDESRIEDIKQILGEHATQAATTSYLGDCQNGQALGIYSEMLGVVRKILTGVFAEKGSFSIRNFVRERRGKTLFIEYDMAIGDSLSPIYSLLFDLALKEALGRSTNKGNVYLICDEFKLLPLLQHIEDGVNFGRGLGVKILAGLQSINQFYEVYGEYRGRNIAAGFSSIFAFKANDPDTRKYVTDLFGKNVILEQRKGISNSIIEERFVSNTVEDWDFNSLSVGEAIVGLPFRKPFCFKFDLYV